MFLKLFKALVRSHLEYGNVIWSPYLKRQSIQVERIQRRATKLVPECKEMNYQQRLRFLNLFSLKGRRVRGDLIQVYKICHNIDDIDANKLLPFTNYSSTRNQTYKLRQRFSKRDIRKFTFTNRVVNNWNSLPEEVKNAPSVDAFKNRLHKAMNKTEKLYDYD